jgi:hypothetical protein
MKRLFPVFFVCSFSALAVPAAALAADDLCVLPSGASGLTALALTVKADPQGVLTGSLVEVRLWRHRPIGAKTILGSVAVVKTETGGQASYDGENFHLLLPTNSLIGRLQADLGGSHLDATVDDSHFTQVFSADECALD